MIGLSEIMEFQLFAAVPEVEAPIPEPASALLVVTGLPLVLRRRRRS